MQAGVRLDAAVLRDAQEHYTVDSLLYGEVKLVDAEFRVAAGKLARKDLAPLLDFFEELGIDLARAALALDALDVSVERALPHGIMREYIVDVPELCGVVPEGIVCDPADFRAVGGRRLGAALVHRELFEVCKDGKRELRAPGVTPELVCGVFVVLYVY